MINTFREITKVFATVWSVDANEQKLVNWLNNGVDQMLLNGTVSRIVENITQGVSFQQHPPIK